MTAAMIAPALLAIARRVPCPQAVALDPNAAVLQPWLPSRGRSAALVGQHRRPRAVVAIGPSCCTPHCLVDFFRPSTALRVIKFYTKTQVFHKN